MIVNGSSSKKMIRALAVMGDVGIVAGSLFLALTFCGVYHSDFNRVFLSYGAIFLTVTVLVFVIMDLYSFKAEHVYNTIVSVEIATITAYVCSFLLCYVLKIQRQVGLFWTVLLLLLLVLMTIWRSCFSIFKKKTAEKRKMLIVENMNNTSRLARKLKYASNEENKSWYHLVDENNEAEIETLLHDVLKEFDAVFISPHISSKLALQLLYKAESLGIEANILANIDAVTTLSGQIYQIDDTPVIIKKGIHLTRTQRFLKRSFDIFFSVVMSLISLPVFAVCALAIKLDSPGPVFYKQERYTINKRVFNIFKFRTMVVDAEKNGAQLSTENDSRITKVGRVLRALRLDELPQIYNILLGDMSVVGPRPERPIFADEFSRNVESYDLRYCLKAGLTGYAQVYGRYNTRVSDKILMDIAYGTTYTFLLDIKIIMLTLKTMCMRSATEGVDEERDQLLIQRESEQIRRQATLDYIAEIKKQKRNKKDRRSDYD